MYQNTELDQLLVGLKRHLIRSQDTSAKKSDRLESLQNISEVLEFVIVNLDQIPEQEIRTVLGRFFMHLLTKVKIALVSLNTTPVKFDEEIGFISILMKV